MPNPIDPTTDCPPCARCESPLGTPIKEAEVDRWDGPPSLPCPRCGRRVAWHFTFGVPNPMRHYAANSKRWCRRKEKV